MTANPPAAAPLDEVDKLFAAGEEYAAAELLQRNLSHFGCALRLREWLVAERRTEALPAVLQRIEREQDHPEAVVSQAIRLQLAGDAEGALNLLREVRGREPQLASAHHYAGRSLHNLGRRNEALAALRLALQLQPDGKEIQYSLAHALRASGRMDESVAAYEGALTGRPGFRAALLNLGITLSVSDRPQQALDVLERLLQLEPANVEALLNRGLCLHVLGRLDQAEACYRQVLERDPAHPVAHFQLGCLLNEQLQSEPARMHLEAALRADPSDPETLTELAGLMEQRSKLDLAQRYVSRGLAIAPEHPGLLLESARLARRAGRLDEARERLVWMDAERLPARLAQQYWFECALTQDRCNDADAAMDALQRANALAAASPRRQQVDPAAFPARLQRIEDWLRDGARGGRPDPLDPPLSLPFRPAFLVGFPRSGTTLLDTFLDAHPAVASIDERPTLELAFDECSGGQGYPVGMPELETIDISDVRARYVCAAQQWLPEGFGGTVLDKLPLRALQAPLIARLFPTAPILFALRHPCDVVLSNVMQQYRANEAFVHFDSIESAARTYDRVMRIWWMIEPLLDRPAHTIRYESLVESPEDVLAGACAALGIELQPRMLDPEARGEGRERIRSSSYQQVAEPLYGRAVGRWQRYRRWLEPVMPLLLPHIERHGYSAD